MIESILDSIKKTLNLASDYTPFDEEVLMHINSVFGTLHQLGIGPVEGFAIEDKDSVWSEFFGSDPRLNSIKTYIYLRVKLLFDPPGTGFHTTAISEQIKELEWRLNVQREDTEWVNPETLMPLGVPPVEFDLF